MLDGRHVSSMQFDDMFESSRAALEGSARGCAELVKSFVGREWNPVRKWIDGQRSRLTASGNDCVVSDDTFIAVLIAHSASYRKVTPKLLLNEIIRHQTVSILFRN